MADEEESKSETEEENENENGAENEEGGSKKKLIIIVAAVVLLAAGGAAFFLLSGGDEAEEEEAAEEQAEVIQPANYHPLTPAFVVNVAQGNRSRFLQASITLMTRDPLMLNNLTLHEPLIRARLNALLAAKEYDELRTPEGRDNARDEALQVVQEIMTSEVGQPVVEQLFFTDFVLQ